MNFKELTIEEFTTVDPVTVDWSASLDKIEEIMQEKGIRHLPVMDQGKVVGIVSERDLKMAFCSREDVELIARDIMTPDPYTVPYNILLRDAVFHMSKYKIGSALVMDENDQLMGIFTSIDALNAIIEDL